MILAGCGGGSSSTTTATTTATDGTAAKKAADTGSANNSAANKPKEPVTIKFVTLGSGGTEPAAFKELFEQYEKASGNKVDLQILPDVSLYENMIKTRFATNDAPDMFYFFAGPNVNITLQAEKNLMEMTNEDYVKRLTPAVKDFYTVNGKMYGIPWGIYNAMGVLYNKKVFTDLGLSVPQNYQELLAAAEKIKGAGITPFYEAVKTGWPTQVFPLASFQSFVLPTIGGMEGVKKLKENTMRFTDIPELKKVFERHYELKTKGYFNSDLLSGTYENQQEALTTGKAAMVFQADWMMPIIAQRFPDKVKDIGFFPLPSDKGPGTISLYPPKQLLVTKTSKNADAAMDLTRFLTKPESFKIWYKHNPGIPVYNGIETTLVPAQQDIYKYINDGNGIIQIQLQLNAGVFDFDKITQELLIKGDADKAVKSMDENYRQDGKNKKIPGF
ncbi:ABC transporter substrate-binding protein [Paenibacillus piri]|nr:extracellular solute-binding protein [Paenibacillus piri]